MYETHGQRLAEWESVIINCELTLPGFGRRFEIAYTNLKNWFFNGTIPNEKSIKRMEEALSQIRNTAAIPFHPSFGYATAEQIERLKSPISQYEREQILKQVERQTKLRGKID